MGQIQGAVNQVLGIAAGASGIVKTGKQASARNIASDMALKAKVQGFTPEQKQAYGKILGKKNQFARKTFDAEIMKKAMMNVSEEIAAKQSIRQSFMAGISAITGQIGGNK